MVYRRPGTMACWKAGLGVFPHADMAKRRHHALEPILCRKHDIGSSLRSGPYSPYQLWSRCADLEHVRELVNAAFLGN